MPKESYVHEDVTLVCTSGFIPSKMGVAERRVTAKGKKFATELDKPTNFMCKWMGVLMAVAMGIVAAMLAIPFAAALLIAFLAGMASAAGHGSILCWLLLQSSKWVNPHSKVKVGGIPALTEMAQLSCPIGGGTIQMFFSREMAIEQNWLNVTKNTIEIAGAALMGRGIVGIFTAIAGSSPVWGSAFFGFSCGVISQGVQLIGWAAIGYGMSEAANIGANAINDGVFNDDYRVNARKIYLNTISSK